MERGCRRKNLADAVGALGSVSYTLKSEDITREENRVLLSPYNANKSVGECFHSNDNSASFVDKQMQIFSKFTLGEGILLEASTENPGISEFGINLDLILLKKSGDYRYQFLPTSPGSSSDGKYHWCIMTRPGGGFLLAAVMQQLKQGLSSS